MRANGHTVCDHDYTTGNTTGREPTTTVRPTWKVGLWWRTRLRHGGLHICVAGGLRVGWLAAISITFQGERAMPDFLYCLNSSTIRPVPILKKIEIAGKAGYSAIELWHDDIDAHLAGGGTLQEIRWALDDHDLDVPTTIYLKGWFETTGPSHTAQLDECKRRMIQSVALGAIHMI